MLITLLVLLVVYAALMAMPSTLAVRRAATVRIGRHIPHRHGHGEA